MAEKRRFELERASWHDARFGNGTPVEIKNTMHEHADGQPGNWKAYREYHEKLRWHGGGDHRGTQQAKISIDAIF
ncbi:hypothetical protein [Natrinema sp. 1APR25-10V2]|uniref:hypothetical protein n=1 Tax=Natrinema sp. 1APR25-10V2 TaxID=2951081 RepID=UPI002875357C|nr:hypothetical protein [Natrinema sp. 1APR25-10V2]MDS0478582.1 hypothetical protein [Natrinema sp. 1APR25-10V2]